MIFNFIFLLYKYFYNGRLIDSNTSVSSFIKNSFGLGKKILYSIEFRMENYQNNLLPDLDKNELDQFLRIIYTTIPYNTSVFRRTRLHICLLDLSSCYKGWRHYKGLPVRGQRTWSNAWSVYKSNHILRNYKLKRSKKFYMNVPVREANVAYTAEYVNMLWRFQWPFEWYSAKVGRLKFKGHPNTMKIDLYSMANYQVMYPLKLKNLTKKQKQSYKRNYFSLGFDPGFTRPLLNSVFNSTISDNFESELKGSKLILRDERLNRKKKK